MADNNIEKRLLEEINKIDEGLALGLLKWIMKPAMKKAMKKLGEDPEFTAAVDDINYQTDRLKRIAKRLKKSPNPEIAKLAKRL